MWSGHRTHVCMYVCMYLYLLCLSRNVHNSQFTIEFNFSTLSKSACSYLSMPRPWPTANGKWPNGQMAKWPNSSSPSSQRDAFCLSSIGLPGPIQVERSSIEPLLCQLWLLSMRVSPSPITIASPFGHRTAPYRTAPPSLSL